MFFKSISEITSHTQTCYIRTKTLLHLTFLNMFWSTAFHVGQLRLHVPCRSFPLALFDLFIAGAFVLLVVWPITDFLASHLKQNTHAYTHTRKLVNTDTIFRFHWENKLCRTAVQRYVHRGAMRNTN